MAGYIIAEVTIHDRDGYEDYKKQVAPTIEAYGGRILARGGYAEALEGTAVGDRVVILEFDTVEQARRWWASPEYSGPKALRQQLSEGRVLLVEGA
jgi:uncharacterized protein (DUF1330 family)